MYVSFWATLQCGPDDAMVACIKKRVGVINAIYRVVQKEASCKKGLMGGDWKIVVQK